jgi:hypothetical protein
VWPAEVGEHGLHLLPAQRLGLALRAAPQQRRDRRPVRHPRADAVRMKEEAHQIALAAAQPRPEIGSESSAQQVEGSIREADVPRPVEDDGRTRGGAVEHRAQRVHHLGHLRVVERAGAEQGREAGRGEPVVSIAQRHGERFAQLKDHRAARLGAAGLEEAHVALRDARGERELELRHAPLGAPALQQRRKAGARPAEHLRRGSGHDSPAGRECRALSVAVQRPRR